MSETPPLLVLSGLASGGLEREEIASLPGRIADAVPVDSILATIAVDPRATHCTVVSRSGTYTASIPIAELRSGGWLVIALDGAPLPADRGGPLRLTVSEGRTLCWNVKNVGELRFTEAKEPDSVPENPPH